MAQQGTDFILPVALSGVELDACEKVEIVFKAKNSQSAAALKTATYPTDAERVTGENTILVPWTKAETYLWADGAWVYMGVRVTLTDSSDQPEVPTVAFKMTPTLFAKEG